MKEESINLGIITSPQICINYPIYVDNRSGQPIVIKSIKIIKNGKGVNIKVATFLKYMVPLPAEQEEFRAIILIASADKDME